MEPDNLIKTHRVTSDHIVITAPDITRHHIAAHRRVSETRCCFRLSTTVSAVMEYGPAHRASDPSRPASGVVATESLGVDGEQNSCEIAIIPVRMFVKADSVEGKMLSVSKTFRFPDLEVTRMVNRFEVETFIEMRRIQLTDIKSCPSHRVSLFLYITFIYSAN